MTTLERSASLGLADLRVDTPSIPAQRSPEPVQARAEITSTGVPWGTVLSFAALIAFADGFWVTAMRGAAGAIERTSGPTLTWLRESTLALPLYVGGILVALMIAVGIVGPVIRSRRALLTSAALIVGAGSLTGIIVLVASSAYDYRLQLDLIHVGGAMPGMCATADCLRDQQAASFDVQLKAVAIGTVLILLTNLVVVAWVLAARGGRLRLTRLHVVHPPVADNIVARTRADARTVVLAAALGGAAVIHAAVVPEHLEQWTLAGVFFTVLAASEALLAAFVVLEPTRLVLGSTVAVSVVPLLLWALSRSVGLPFGPEPGVPEAVGLADLACCALELLALVLAVGLLVAPRERSSSILAEHARWLAVAGVLTVAALGIGGTVVAPILQDGASAASDAIHHDGTQQEGATPATLLPGSQALLDQQAASQKATSLQPGSR